MNALKTHSTKQQVQFIGTAVLYLWKNKASIIPIWGTIFGCWGVISHQILLPVLKPVLREFHDSRAMDHMITIDSLRDVVWRIGKAQRLLIEEAFPTAIGEYEDGMESMWEDRDDED